MKTRNRQQQEIEWLKEKIILLERIVELERQLREANRTTITIPAYPNPFTPFTPDPWWDPYKPTWIGDTTSQTIMVDDRCQVFMTTN